MMDQLQASTATLAILNNSQFQLPDEAADTYWQLQRWPLALQEELEAGAERIKGYHGQFQEQLHEDQQQLQAELQQLQVGGPHLKLLQGQLHPTAGHEPGGQQDPCTGNICNLMKR